MKPVEEAWLLFRKMAIPPCLHPEGVERLKEAFYAGYYQAILLVQDCQEANWTEEKKQQWADAADELNAFRLSKGVERN